MVNNLIHEISVVAHYYHATREVLQIFLQHLKSLDIEVVSGLIENQEIRVAHQNGAQIQLSLLAS
jgi:hypothetical protein